MDGIIDGRVVGREDGLKLGRAREGAKASH